MPVRSQGEERDRRAGLALLPVSRETEDCLAIYVERLRQWQAVKNLVGPASLQHVWTRHIADCGQLVDLAPDAQRWVDLGSGAGFPGLVVAILLRGRPGASVDLIESNARKCAFLRDVVRATGAPARVHAARIEHVVATLGAVDIVTARALAPLPDLLALSRPLLEQGATGLFMKGEEEGEPRSDVATAPYRIDSVVSRTHAGGRILVVRRPDSCDTAR